MTGGAAARDYDGDGWVDLYVTRLDAPDLLFRNRGDGTFEDVTVQANLDLDLRDRPPHDWAGASASAPLAEPRKLLFKRPGPAVPKAFSHVLSPRLRSSL